MKKFIFVLISSVLLAGCSPKQNNAQNGEKPIENSPSLKVEKNTENKPVSSTTPAAIPSPIATSSPEETLSYEVLSESPQGTSNRVEVYTIEKDNEKLVKINDELLEKYKPGLTHLNIDYFDNKDAADGYFKKQLDESISESEKDKLYSHYIANMIYNTSTGSKNFVKQGKSQIVLKKY